MEAWGNLEKNKPGVCVCVFERAEKAKKEKKKRGWSIIDEKVEVDYFMCLTTRRVEFFVLH